MPPSIAQHDLQRHEVVPLLQRLELQELELALPLPVRELMVLLQPHVLQVVFELVLQQELELQRALGQQQLE
jgi:hypothetical protein